MEQNVFQGVLKVLQLKRHSKRLVRRTAKHFYGADVDFQRKKMAKQMTRYIEEWGSGAVVYRHGFSANLFMPGCTLLDANVLDLSKLGPGE